VQAAINAAAVGTAANPSRIHIAPGSYVEQLSVSSSKRFLQLIGNDPNPANTVLTYILNAQSPNGSGGTVGTTGSASTVVSANNFSAANLTFANSTDSPLSFPATSVQAVAIKTQADQVAFQNCRFLGYQDTLYATRGRQYFKDCYVTGDNDFIFADSTSVFDHCTINVDGNHNGGCITAASTDTTKANGFVFLNCTVTGNSVRGEPTINPSNTAAATVSNNAYNLGRSWGYQQTGGDSSAIWINTKMSPAITSAGWIKWVSTEASPGQDSRYAEYNTMDLLGNPISTAGRATWSHQLSPFQAVNFTLSNVFGPGTFWYGAGYADPTSYPTFWGDRDSTNPNNPPGAVSNPTSYSNQTRTGSTVWDTTVATWDPLTQLANVPEPQLLGLLAALSPVCGRRRRSVNSVEGCTKRG
jgi:pectinesterase